MTYKGYAARIDYDDDDRIFTCGSRGFEMVWVSMPIRWTA